MSVILKRKITLPSDKKHIICIEYNTISCLVTIGGSNRLENDLWRVYVMGFGECDGEPHFYPSPIPGKTRLTFRSSYKNYQNALGELAADGYLINEVKTFNKDM